MHNTRVAGQALRLASAPARDPFICRACLAQSTHHFSTSTLRNAQEPFFKRIQKTLFGSKESKAAEAKREAMRKKELEQIKASGRARKTETVRSVTGRSFEVAERVDPITHSDYVSSQDWHGMESIGGEQWVKQRADGGEQYFGFLPPEKAKLTSDEWARLLHTVIVEVLTLQKAGRDVLQVCNARTHGVAVSNEEGESVLDSGVQERAILDSISETETAIEERDPDALELELDEALAAGGGEMFMMMKLEDPRVKFAIVKRTMQLTGNRIPDIVINNAKTLSHLLRAFGAKETPAKLRDTRELQQLDHVANVQVHRTRRTPVDKDKEIGRWKLIQDELSARDLIPRAEPKVAAGSSA